MTQTQNKTKRRGATEKAFPTQILETQTAPEPEEQQQLQLKLKRVKGLQLNKKGMKGLKVKTKLKVSLC